MKRFFKILFVLFFLLIGFTLFFIGKGYKLYIKELRQMSIKEMQEEIKEKENFHPIEEVPQIYIDAVISVEDHRFYKHNGIDLIAIGRAIKTDIKARDFVEGGSTITQQLAKNVYFTQEKTLERKIAEVFMALKIEQILKKDEILELYLNSSYFGEGYYTIREASNGYFSKMPQDMSYGESIMLAGIPNAPSVYNPKQNPVLAKEREWQVLLQMIKYNYLTQEEAEKIYNEEE